MNLRPFETAKAITAAIAAFNTYDAASWPPASKPNFWRMLSEYAQAHTSA